MEDEREPKGPSEDAAADTIRGTVLVSGMGVQGAGANHREFTYWSSEGKSSTANRVGGKGAGLISLPDGWTPPYVVLGRSFHQRWLSTPNSAEVLAADPDAGSAVQAVIHLAPTWSSVAGVLVRSNSPLETQNWQRGRFRSVSCGADFASVCAAIDEVISQGTAAVPVYAVVQLQIRAEIVGHLSNERRVSERASAWLVEESTPEETGQTYSRLTARSHPTDLRAANRLELQGVLRHVASELRGGRERVHCEWLWDRERVWVVQRDVVAADVAPETKRYLSARDADRASQDVPPLEVVRELSDAEADAWRKLRKPVIFSALGMPRAPIFFVDGDSVQRDAAAGWKRLGQDLAGLVRGRRPLVVRCDLARGTVQSDLSLPTSQPTTSVTTLLDFIEAQATALGDKIDAPSRWAFLPAWLVPARASVMVLARPNAQVIRLDALWGFPDGVGLLPHDTYIHEFSANRIEMRRRFKGSCLLWDEHRGWTFATVPPPYDWQAVLDEAEIKLASSWARRLADHLQREVQLMVLARIGGRRGPDAMLPWHYTDHQVPTGVRARARLMPRRGIVTITDAGSLADAKLDRREGVQGVVFRPIVDLRRDASFIEQVGRSAASAGLPIYFEGSLLGHAYYVLREAGADVVVVGASDPTLEADEYNKLVRDRIPEIIRRSGASVRVSSVDSQNALDVLRHKLVEEAVEAWSASDEDLLTELADVVEVVQAVLGRLDATPSALEALRRRRRADRGGFDQLLYLEQTAPDVGAAIRSASSRSRMDGSVNIVEATDDRLVLRMAIAPPLVRGLPLTEQRLPLGSGGMTVRYAGRHIEIEIAAPRPAAPAGQLSLAIELQGEHTDA